MSHQIVEVKENELIDRARNLTEGQKIGNYQFACSTVFSKLSKYQLEEISNKFNEENGTCDVCKNKAYQKYSEKNRYDVTTTYCAHCFLVCEYSVNTQN